MSDVSQNRSGPLVSVMIPTFNRRRYLPTALGSALAQGYRNIEVFVINDGGENVSDIISSFNDPRIRFIDRKENRGKAYSLNEAIGLARGRYVAYLDDDDMWYPHHVETLVSVLESGPETVAYSDLYKSHCRLDKDGERVVVAKKVEVSRDFDRFLMMQMNHVLHVSLMHRLDAIEKTGLYNESLSVFIDWDMARRLAFFCDFRHVHHITGEFFAPAGECDRISIRKRKDKGEYLRNVLTIRTTHPPKPWSKVKELCIIPVPSHVDSAAGQTLRNIWMWTFYPYSVYLPWTAKELSSLNTDMPNVRRVSVPEGLTFEQSVEAAAAVCEGEYVVAVPSGVMPGLMWVEKFLWPLMNSEGQRVAFELDGSTENACCAVMRLEHLREALGTHKEMMLHHRLRAAGVVMRKPEDNELPFRFDEAYERGCLAETRGEWPDAARFYQYAASRHGNQLWMDSLTAEALRKAGRLAAALEYSSRVNGQRPTVDSLYTEAMARKASGDAGAATELLENARDILEGKHTVWA